MGQQPTLPPPPRRFTHRHCKHTDGQQQEELIAQLYQQIGQLKVEVDFLKKKLWTS